jgi:hypothetical protein
VLPFGLRSSVPLTLTQSDGEAITLQDEFGTLILVAAARRGTTPRHGRAPQHPTKPSPSTSDRIADDFETGFPVLAPSSRSSSSYSMSGRNLPSRPMSEVSFVASGDVTPGRHCFPFSTKSSTRSVSFWSAKMTAPRRSRNSSLP